MARNLTLLLILLLSNYYAFTQIAVSVQNGCAPLTNVSFSYSNTSLINHHWDFGDGTSSNAASPAHSFFDPGVYVVTLSGFINSAPFSNTIEITVFPNPEAGFYVDGPNMGCAPLSVLFADTSVGGGVVPIVSRYWDFGDGTSADTSAIGLGHLYTLPGIYGVSLWVTDTNGCQSQVFHNPIVFASSPPIVEFGNNLDSLTDCTPPVDVSFHASASSLFQYADSFSYYWDFGSIQSTLANPVESFMPGNYACSLVVSDNFGCSVVHNFDLIGILPEASFSLDNSPDSVICDTAIFLNLSNTGDIWWHYGDGSTGTDTFHTYNSPGAYTVQLFASMGACVDSTEITLVVEDVQAAYSLSPGYTCSAPVTVQFTDSSLNAVEWLWIFPNGDTSLLQNPSIVFNNPDTSLCSQVDSIIYEPILIVTSSYGCRDTLSAGPEFTFNFPRSRFMPNVSWGFAPLEVNFSDSSYMPDSISSWFWEFGDGNNNLVYVDTIGHLFNFPGNYNVTLTVSNDSGCVDTSYPVTISVFDSATYFQDFLPVSMEVCACFPGCGNYPQPYYSAYNLLLNKMNFDSITPELISNFVTDTGIVEFSRREEKEGQFIDYPIPWPEIKVLGPLVNITYDYDCDSAFQYTFHANAIDATNLEWDFGDGATLTTDTVDSLLHVYLQSGDYLVKLSAFNSTTSCTFSDSIWIYARQPLASFSFPYEVCVNTPVTFNASASIDVHAHCTNGYQWNFGDISPLFNTSASLATHTFTSGGDYRIELTVYDENACKHSVSDSIRVFEIHAQYDLSPLDICSPDTVFFTDSSYADTTIVSWFFEYGDGNTDTLFPAWHFYPSPISGFVNTQLTVTDALGCNNKTSHSFYSHHPQFVISVSDSSFCLGDTVSFSTDPFFTDIAWDFGDGTGSLLPNPEHAYGNPGIYDISVTVSDSLGCADTTLFLNYVEVFPLPEALFSTSFIGDTFCVGQDMIFTNLTDTATLSNWAWESPSSNIYYNTPWYSFSTLHPGNYGSILSVTDYNGCTDSHVDSFILIGPYLDFSTSTGTICPGEEAVFHINNPTYVDGWVVDFGDGTTDSSQNTIIHHTYPPDFYPPSGGQIVSIDYWNDDCTVSTSILLGFHPQVVAGFTLVNWSDSVVCLGDAISLINNSVNSTSWLWDMGVGAPLTDFNINSFQYPAAGNYGINLIASSEQGCKDTASMPVLVTGVYPNLGVTTSVICHNGMAYFTNFSFADAGIFSQNMLFGDGNWSDIFQGSHNYTNPPGFPGNGYNVVLTVTDNQGCSSSVTSFLPFSDPMANFAASNTDPCELEEISFQAYSTFVDYTWDLGTGPPITLPNPDISYSQSGLYTISLIAEDSLGCKDTVTYINYVHVHEIPVVGFSYIPTQGPHCAPATFTFTDNSSCADPYSIVWDYPSGQSSNNPFGITWETGGQFEVTLHVASNFGCEDSSSTVIEIETPTAQLEIEPDEICWGDTVTFTILNPVSLISWDLDFGDGNSAFNNTGSQVSHKYNTMPPSGQFEITLTLHSQNCEAVVHETINAYLPVSKFAVDNPVCAGYPIQFDNQSELANEYAWNFGDGTSSTATNPVHTFTDRGTYWVYLTVKYQPLGCTDASARILTVYDPELNLQLPGDSICLGALETFNITSLIDVAGWSLDFGDNTSHQGNSNASVPHTYPNGFFPPDGTIPITLIMWSPDSLCMETIKKEIYIHNVHAHIGSQNRPNFVMCHGDNIILLNQSVNSDTWDWDFGYGPTQSNTNPLVQLYPNPGQYTVTLNIYDNESGCTDKATQILTVRDDALIESPTFYSCDGEPVQLSVWVDGGANYYEWLPAILLDDPSSGTPSATITQTTSFQLEVIDGYGCSGTATVWVEYVVEPPEIHWADTIIIGDSIEIPTHFDPVFSLLWSNNGTLNCDNCPNPVAFTLQSNTYYLTVSDPGGCFEKISDYTVIVREEDKFSMPTVFTPNGDGLNDIFKVEGWGIKKIIEFKVYNRWGGLVFQTDNKMEGWDGTYKGKNQAVDTYTYIVRVEMWVGNNIREKKGFINLIR